MFDNPRKIVMWLGSVLLFAGGFAAWRALHPPLTDAQQLAANVEYIRASVEARNTNGALGYLAKDFSFQGLTQKEMRLGLVNAFREWRDVQLGITRQQVTVQGDTATTTGHYSLSYRPQDGTAPQVQSGDFTLHWEKRDGRWWITKAEGPATLPE